MKYTLALLGLLLTTPLFAQHPVSRSQYLLVGTYTGKGSTGIYTYRFNKDNGSTELADSATTNNPSYLAVSPDLNTVYAVNETDNGEVKAFSFDRTNGHLTLLNKQSSMGANPCYVTTDHTGQWLFAGNYSSGTIGELPINKDGSLGAPVVQMSHHGHGPNKDRQEGPHVHATVISPDNHWLFAPDLGIDTLKVYSFIAKTGQLTPANNRSIGLPAGTGPRHFVFHPNGKWAYLVQELGGQVTAFKYNPANGRLTTFQSISTLPKGFDKFFTCADIHVSPDGKFLYASIRDSANTLAIFRVNAQTGRLTLIAHQSTLGRTPRNFSFSPNGDYLLAANQNSDDIVIFHVNKSTGLLHDTGRRIAVGKPVCLKWIPQ